MVVPTKWAKCKLPWCGGAIPHENECFSWLASVTSETIWWRWSSKNRVRCHSVRSRYGLTSSMSSSSFVSINHAPMTSPTRMFISTALLFRKSHNHKFTSWRLIDRRVSMLKEYFWRIAVSRAKDVPAFGPPLPAGATYPKCAEFHDFLLTKSMSCFFLDVTWGDALCRVREGSYLVRAEFCKYIRCFELISSLYSIFVSVKV